MTRGGRARLAAVGALAGVLLTATPALAAGGLDDVTTLPGDRLRVTATPAVEGDVDLATSSMTLDGEPLQAVVQRAANAGVVRQVAVVVGTEGGPRDLTAMRTAVLAFVDALPADVAVGLVSGGPDAELLVAPTIDRSLVRLTLGGLEPSDAGDLDAAVSTAASSLAPGALGSVLVAAQADVATSGDAASALGDADRRLDVLGDAAAGDLGALASRSGGTAISGTPQVLDETALGLAEAWDRQVVLTAPLPADLEGGEHRLELTLGADGVTATTTHDVDVAVTEAPATGLVIGGVRLEQWQVYAGVGLMGLGLLVALLALMLRPKPQPTDILTQQVGLYGQAAKNRTGPVSLPAPTSITEHAQDIAARALANNQGLQAKVAARLQGADVDMRPAEWLPVHGVIGLIVGAVGMLLTSGSIIGLIVGVLLGLLVPWVVLGIRQSRRISAFQGQLAETLQLMAGSLQAGLSLAQSIDTIVREGGEPVASEFRRAVVEARLGVDLEDAMEAIADRMQSRDFKWVVMAIRIQRSVGGNLAELLLKVAGTLREREYIRRHVRALSAEGRLSVYVLGGLPPVFLAYLAATNWDYVSVLFFTPLGWIMLGGMAVLLTLGVTWMTKVSKVAF